MSEPIYFIDVNESPVYSSPYWSEFAMRVMKLIERTNGRIDTYYMQDGEKRDMFYRRSLIVCSECSTELLPSTTFFYDGLIYCPQCLPEYDKHQQW